MLEKDAAAFGIALPKPEPEPDFEVLPENWDALTLFLKVQTQWRTTMGGVIGLDYASVISTAKLYEYKNLGSVLQDLQVIEVAALAEMNKEKK